jgi:hypothetical protein
MRHPFLWILVACGGNAPTPATSVGNWPDCPDEIPLPMLPDGTATMSDLADDNPDLSGWDVTQSVSPGTSVPTGGLDLTLDLRADGVHLRCETRVVPQDRVPPELAVAGTWTEREGLVWTADATDDVASSADLTWSFTLDGQVVADLDAAAVSAPGPHCLAATVTDRHGNIARAMACELAHPSGWRPLHAELIANACARRPDGYEVDAVLRVLAASGWDPRNLDASSVRLHLLADGAPYGDPTPIAGAFAHPESEGLYHHPSAEVVAAPCGAEARFVASGLDRCPDAFAITGSNVVGGSWTAELRLSDPPQVSECDAGSEPPRTPTSTGACACTWKALWTVAPRPDIDHDSSGYWECGGFRSRYQVAKSDSTSHFGYIGATGHSLDGCLGWQQASTNALSAARVRVFAECTPRRCGQGCCDPQNAITSLPTWAAEAGPIDEDAYCHVAGAMLVAGAGVSAEAKGMFTAGAAAETSVTLGLDAGITVTAAPLPSAGSATTTATGGTSGVPDRCAFDLTFQGAVDHHAASDALIGFAQCSVWTRDVGFHTAVDAYCQDGSDGFSPGVPWRLDIP